MEIEVFVLNIAFMDEKKQLEVKKDFPTLFNNHLNKINKSDFLLSVGGLYLLKKAFYQINESQINYKTFGKPYCDNLFFNISHDGDYVVLAKSKEEVGVDIIDFNRKIKYDLAKVFSEEEKEMCKNGTEKELILDIFSKKEAVVKLTGEGLTRGFNSFSVNDFYNGKPIKIKSSDEDCREDFVFNSKVNFDHYFINVCSFNKIDKILINKGY